MTKILILCTGNSCRSQMAEGFLKSFDNNLEVTSAGTFPTSNINPLAVEVMKEVGIDITKGFPKNVNNFLKDSFDYVITVCDNARETCPIFSGNVKENIHISIEDPVGAKGSYEEVIEVYRKVRDKIREEFSIFYSKRLKNN